MNCLTFWAFFSQWSTRLASWLIRVRSLPKIALPHVALGVAYVVYCGAGVSPAFFQGTGSPDVFLGRRDARITIQEPP